MPTISRLKRAKNSKVMKGRRITEAEFKAMLDATESVVGVGAAASWRYYLVGLWASGLKLAESLDLYWDDASKLCVVFEEGDVMLRVPAEMEKGHKDRLLPVAPEFADFLLAVPMADRRDRVFNLKARKARGDRLTADHVTRVVSKIGRIAGVIVDPRTSKPATAHDLRRSFGERWARRVMPQVLMELMRHESIETTLRYYVDKNAQRTSRLLREAYESEMKANGKTTKTDLRDTSRDTSHQEPNNDLPPAA